MDGVNTVTCALRYLANAFLLSLVLRDYMNPGFYKQSTNSDWAFDMAPFDIAKNASSRVVTRCVKL